MTYASAVLATSPLLYWRLGETSGTVANDSSGNGRHGTYVNSPTLGVTGLLTGDSDKAVDLDGTNDWVSYADTTDLTAFTAIAWIKTTAPGRYIVSRYAGSGSRIFRMFLDATTGALRADVLNSGGTQGTAVATSPNLADGAVHMVALVYDPTVTNRIILYADGVQVAAVSHTGTLPTADVTFLVGATSSAVTTFDGVIDEVSYNDVALSGSQIAALYASGTTPPPADITIHPAKITSTSTVRAPAIVPYVAPVDGNITITAELTPARWSAAAVEPDRSAEIQPARHTAGVQS